MLRPQGVRVWTGTDTREPLQARKLSACWLWQGRVRRGLGTHFSHSSDRKGAALKFWVNLNHC